MWSTPRVDGGLASPPSASQGGGFPRLVFLLFQIKAKGWRHLSRWIRRFARAISTDVVRPQASKWADPKERHPLPGS